jgi:RNA methyltransferase, TrmH family
MILTSPQNPRVKQVIALRERKERKRTGQLVIEGRDEIALALTSGVQPQTVFFCPALFGQSDPSPLQDQLRGTSAEKIEVDERVFQKMAYRENPDGWLAVAALPYLTLDELQLKSPAFLVVVEAVEKPGNLGAILRSADAAGVDGLILCDPTVDIGNPNVIRASRGTAFSVKVAEATSAQTLAWLQQKNISVVASTPEASQPFTQLNLRVPLAVAVGTEDKGLSDLWRQGATLTASIPMLGQVNSLNVAQAATLFLFEVVRQRHL